MKVYLNLLLFLSASAMLRGQSYTSFFTGNSNDVITSPKGGLCLMGGATEDDNAMKWFLERADGGDVLVLRASGSDGYNNYMYTGLGVSVNSVETIVFNSAAAASDPYVLQKIEQAEAIWIAGGDQWNYVTYWRNNAVDSLINRGIKNRKIVIGGTSAGMAIQGRYYFSAQNGTVSSATALSDPFNSLVTVDSNVFLTNPYMEDVITDTHFDNPDRRGRLSVFLAKMYSDYGVNAKGIACDEYTAVCVDTNGLARVFGGHPTYDDNAYFVQVNCELPDQSPEVYSSGSPLTWNRGASALKVYQVKGTSNGANTFDLTNWEIGNGGVWENWSVNAGVFQNQAGNAINCASLSTEGFDYKAELLMFPNPLIAGRTLNLRVSLSESPVSSIKVFDMRGAEVKSEFSAGSDGHIELKSDRMESGLYVVVMRLESGASFVEKLQVY